MSDIDAEQNAEEQLDSLINADVQWKGMGEMDHEELLVHIQAHLKELSEKLHISEERIDEAIELRKLILAEKLGNKDPKALKLLKEHNSRFESVLSKNDSKLYEKLLQKRREALDHLRKTNPEYSDIIDEFYRK